MARRGSKPQVTLTFAGDSEDLEKAFDRVGDSAEKMEQRVESSGEGFDKAAEGFDRAEQRAMGFRDTLTGVQDTAAGFGEIMRGNVFEGALQLGAGIGDLASGFANLLIPSLKNAVAWLGRTRVGMLAQATASKVVSGATKAWAGVQAAMNAVLAVNPIFLVIGAIAALVAIIVVIEKRTGFFSDLWHKVWERIGDPIKAVWEWISETFWPGIRDVLDGVVDRARGVWEGIRDAFGRVLEFIGSLPDRISRAARGMWDGITDGVRAAVNTVIDAWNRLDLSVGPFTIPWWVPGLGNKTFHIPDLFPDLPRLHTGGTFRAPVPGGEGLAVLRDRERVLPPGQTPVVRLEVAGDGTRLGDALVDLLARAVRVRGGDVQLVLGGRRA